MVNKVILIGNLGQDPEAPRKTNSGLSVLDISIATTRKRGGESHTDWHTITCFGQTADNVHKFLQKGRQVYIEGRLQYDSWTDEKTGQKRKKAKIVADNVTFLSRQNTEGASSGGSSSGGSSYSKSSAPMPDFSSNQGDEDIPF
jgi:single-strand DNA-binding protein